MSKEYVLQFNLNNYISVEEPYKKDLGTVIIGKVNDDSGILNVLFDSHKEDIVNFFIELINYVSDLEAKLAESEKEIKDLVEWGYNERKNADNWESDYYQANQDKISFALEQLEKVKEFNIQQVFSSKPLDNFIDNQIKQLKEMK